MTEEKQEGWQSRRPDYLLSCLHRTSKAKGKIGAAWNNSDGSIRIKLDNFVVLPPPGEITLTLFPAGGYSRTGQEQQQETEEFR